MEFIIKYINFDQIIKDGNVDATKVVIKYIQPTVDHLMIAIRLNNVELVNVLLPFITPCNPMQLLLAILDSDNIEFMKMFEDIVKTQRVNLYAQIKSLKMFEYMYKLKMLKPSVDILACKFLHENDEIMKYDCLIQSHNPIYTIKRYYFTLNYLLLTNPDMHYEIMRHYLRAHGPKKLTAKNKEYYKGDPMVFN